MLLRTLVNQFLRQKAYDEISKAARSHGITPPSAATAAHGDDEADEASPCHVAFVFALGIESGGFVNSLADLASRRRAGFVEHVGTLGGCRIVIADAGVGREKAAAVTQEVIAAHQPQWVVSAGFAASLSEDVRRGHILMADEVTDTHGEKIDVGLRMDPESLKSIKGLHVGRLLTVEQIVTLPPEKHQLAERFGAVACDMETIAVAEVCAARQVRFLSVRVISDGLDDALPQELEHLVHQPSLAGKLGAVTGAIFRRPSSVKEMWKMKAEAVKASQRLAKFVQSILPQLEADSEP